MSPVARLTTFRGRLTLRWTLAVGLLLGVANVAVYAGARLYLHRWLDHNVRTLAATETASATDGVATDVHLHEGPFGQLGSGAFTEKLVQIFDSDGRLVLQSTGHRTLPPLVSRAVLVEAFAGRAPVVWAEADGHRVRVAILTAAREQRRYAVAVGLLADDIEAGLRDLAWLLAVVWGVSLTVSGAIGYALASRVLDPVARITEKAAWIADGHFEGRLGVTASDDELGRMTRLLDSMLDRLRGALEANRRFASDASHELRGPLTAIAGEIDVALRYPRTPESYQDTLHRVRGAMTALTKLTEDLILLVRAQEGTRQVTLREVPLSSLVADAFERVRPLATSRRLTLTARGLDGLQLYGEPTLLARVLDNVIQNAVHYNRDGGQVEVAARVEEPPPGVWATPVVQIDVRDTGTGIPDAQREQVFERFFRVDQARARHLGGSGLGLAISREVLRLHAGTIRVGQTSVEGTTIEVRVPGRGPEPAVAEDVSGHPEASRRPA